MPTAQHIPDRTALVDARESYAYWRSRRSTLSWHRRAARREARILAARWRARLVRAHLERLGLETTVIADSVLRILGRTRRDHARWLWRTVGRRTLLASRALWLTVALAGAAMATIAVLAVHAVWVVLF